MKAVIIDKHGPADHLVSRDFPDPGDPQGRDLLIRVEACSVNPVDVKVRGGVYDDFPDYYSMTPKPYQVAGFDGAGTILQTGPDCTLPFQKGDKVFYSGSPIRQGSNAEYQFVDERSVGHKPARLDMTQAAAMPLTYLTAYEALVERLQIPKGEKGAGLLIINGSGGVGSIATQIARHLLGMEVVVTTASKPEKVQFSKNMGATHIVNHHGDLESQLRDLKLDVPLKYIFITHTTDQYLPLCARICAPFGKVCTIVQGQARMYGTEFMAKSLSFIWCLIGTKGVYKAAQETHHEALEELARLVDEGRIKCHLTRRVKLTLEGLREAHRTLEEGGLMGKIALGVNEEGGGEPFV